MSADNGIYILKNPSQFGHGSEYRIGYAAAIDNFTPPDRYEAEKCARQIFRLKTQYNTKQK